MKSSPLLVAVVLVGFLAADLGLRPSPTGAVAPCASRSCKQSILTACAGLEGRARQACRRGVIAACRAGECSCTGAEPSCGTTTTTTSSTHSTLTCTTTTQPPPCGGDHFGRCPGAQVCTGDPTNGFSCVGDPVPCTSNDGSPICGLEVCPPGMQCVTVFGEPPLHCDESHCECR